MVYKLAFKASNETAEKFQDWLAIEVLPQIRKTGSYQKQLSAMEQLRLQYQVAEEHDSRITKLENTMTIDYGQQQELRKLAQSKALEVMGGKDSPVYKDKSIRTKVFSGVWSDFKDYFQINSYHNTATKELGKAIEYIKGWKPQGKLLRQVEDMNGQIRI